MVKKNINREIKTQIDLFSEKLHQEKIKPEFLILFGSYAKGTEKSYSDIDIGVVMSKNFQDELKEVSRLRLIASEIDWRIEPHLISLNDLKTRSNPFIWEVISTGIKVV